MANITFDLPFKGQDLKPGERYSRAEKIHTTDPNNTQHFAYDLQAKRWDAQSKLWTSFVSSPNIVTNENHVVYGKPVYAIADGEVTHAWRNAPDNPVPGEGKHHPNMDGVKISNAGNFLKVRNADGEDILYGHFKPGSILKSLCPGDIFDEPFRKSMADSEIPPSKRPNIKRGQLLGLVGNSGHSGGPHLHIHWENAGKPLEIRFRHGLATPLQGGKADIDNWISFAGKPIPPGPILIWPPRTVEHEFARHKFPAEDFGAWFDHLADSGCWPNWIDGYSVGSQLFYNFIWTKAPGEWRGFFGQTSTAFQKQVDDAKSDGFAPVFVESYTVNNQVLYAVVFQKGKPGKWLLRHELSFPQHDSLLDQAKADGLNPINISVVSIAGQRQYTVLYRADNIGVWQVESRIEEPDYQDVIDKNKDSNRSPIYLNAYVHDNKPFLSAVFASKPTGNFRARHSLSVEGYQSEYEDAIHDGLSTQLVTSFDGAKTQHGYAAVWRKN